MNVVLLQASEVAPDGRARLTGPRAAHVTKVLALGVGQSFRIGVVDGPLGTAQLLAAEGDALEIACTLEPSAPAPPAIDLVLALPRPKVLARLLSPIAQLGVRRLILTGAWKVERFYFDAHVLSPEHHLPELLEGLAQARDTRLPIVTIHRSIAYLLDHELDGLVGDAARVVVDPSGPAALEATLAGGRQERLALAIGPEGGFTGRELRHLEARGFVAASLGARILRSDVATIATLARAHASWGARG
ncbi:MAG: RsmE family RNA methyltransferase [Sandaracinus sp.]